MHKRLPDNTPKMKKALVIRMGALGDNIIITPILRLLKEEGYEVVVYTGDRGLSVFKNNPYIDRFIKYENEKNHNPDIEADWARVIEEEKADRVINFSASIEVNVTAHPKSAYYNYPKNETPEKLKRNFYDATADYGVFGFHCSGCCNHFAFARHVRVFEGHRHFDGLYN
jgi:ADP-heptose:LPS heptosyltransferase